MNKILIFLLAASISGCSTLPVQYSASPTRCLVEGVSIKDTSVQIRFIDGGEVIWVRRGQIGDRVWLEPGLHKVSVVCATEEKAGLYTVDADVEINIQSGYEYFISASRFNGISKPHVQVAKKKRQR